MSIPRDVEEFLDEYPDVLDDPTSRANLEFYSNNLRCRPDNRKVEEIHKRWFGQYDKLEYKHGYIQWLFPIREYGMNFESQPLQTHEIRAMKADPTIVARVIESYKLMLDFYGMRLVSADTGLVARALPPRNYEGRYRNLVRSSHNNLRISRILKCLSELGLERLNAGFLLHVLSEQSEANELNSRGIRGSMDRWWANCLRNEEERLWIGDLIRLVREEDCVFTREDYEQALDRRAQTGQLGTQEDTVPPGEKEGTVTPGDQEDTVTPGDKEDTVTPRDQEETATPGDKEEIVTPEDKEEIVTPGNQEETVAPGDREGPVTKSDQRETVPTGDTIVELAGEGTHDN